MLDWYITEMEQRYQDRLREAECRRYVLEVSHATPRQHSGVGDKALASVGHLLVEWGRQLESRHSVAYASGFADGHDGFGEMSVESFAPRTAARVTGRAYRR